MIETQFLLNNIAEYVSSDDVKMRHGLFEFKVDGIISFLENNQRIEAMNNIERIISTPYFKAVSEFENKIINEDEYWGKVARYTDTFQILRNIRRKYNLPESTIL